MTLPAVTKTNVFLNVIKLFKQYLQSEEKNIHVCEYVCVLITDVKEIDLWEASIKINAWYI